MKAILLASILFFSLLMLIAGLIHPCADISGGDSMSDATEIEVDTEYICISPPSSEEWYKFWTYAGNTYTVTIYPSDDLDVDLRIYNSTGNLIGSSIYGAGAEDEVDFTAQYDGWYYIKVSYISGNGGYNMLASSDGSQASQCSGDNGGGGGGGSCPDGCNPPFSCSCEVPVLGWDPCAALANVYCTITGFFNGIVDGIHSFVDTISSFFHSIVNGIASFFNAVENAITSFANGIMDAINTVINGIESFITGIANAIRTFFETIANGIQSFFRTIADAIRSGIEGVVDFFKSLVDGIIDGLESILNGISSGLGNSLEGLKDWISDNGLLTVGAILLLAGLLFGGGWLAGLGAIVLIAGAVQSGMLSGWALVVAAGLLLLALSSKR